MKLKTKIINHFRKLFRNHILDNWLSSQIGKNPKSLFLKKIIPGNSLYSKGSKRRCKRNGINFDLDLSDYPDWSLYFNSETDSSKNVLSYVNTGDTVLDIGGNIGQTALMIAKKIGGKGKVISFEPYPNTIKRFEGNLSLNETISNITLVKCGLGNEEMTTTMYQNCSSNSAGNRIGDEISKGENQVKKVVIKVLDNFLQNEEKLERVDFIKIDVEGYEMNVLRGARKTLLNYKPKLFIEINDNLLRKQGSDSSKLLAFLLDLEYEITDLLTMKKISEAKEIMAHTDIFCEPKHKLNY